MNAPQALYDLAIEDTALPMVVNRDSRVGGPESFYRRAGDRIDATDLTRGPWDPESQHAGPPSALIGREIERCPGIGEGVEDRIVGRVTYEILRPVPIAAGLQLSAEVLRPGRRVDMVGATLRAADGEELVSARAWRLLRREVDLPPGLGSRDPDSAASRAGRPSAGSGRPTSPLDLPSGVNFFPTGQQVGYHSGMEYRFESGGFVEDGPGVCWMRMRQPLIEGEEPTPLQRVLIAADTGNGISSTLDFRDYLYINVDLSVHLHRMPAGDWICLDALTVPEPTGVGMADTLLFDQLGTIGRACQTLLVAER